MTIIYKGMWLKNVFYPSSDAPFYFYVAVDGIIKSYNRRMCYGEFHLKAHFINP